PSQARSASARGRPAQSPPYNIVKVDEQQYTIEVAVPGYARENIVVEQDGTQLNIRGEPQTADASEGPAALTATPAEESGTAAEESGTVAETGVASPGEATSPYLHRGFGAEQFALSFALNDRAEVTEGEVANGVLRVSISIPPELQPKRVTLT
ncbi:MAG: hypothetical protein K0U36_04450, partial [Alphaproteobacteria bacterium]|nr:hypothetical protein [Alphaproteobacteria bacterium]